MPSVTLDSIRRECIRVGTLVHAAKATELRDAVSAIQVKADQLAPSAATDEVLAEMAASLAAIENQIT